MKRFIQEFKEFAIKGNMVDLAVGMIIGSAFTSLVKSVVDNLFMPILSIFTGKLDFTNMFIPLRLRLPQVEPTPAAPTTKICPYCMSEIDVKATRCPHCTSKLEGFQIDPAELNS